MAATQFIIGAYNKIVELLEAHEPFIGGVREMCLIDWTENRKINRKRQLASSKAPADYAEIELGITTGDDTGYTLTQHFGMKNPAALASSLVWTEQITQVYVLRITTEPKQLAVPQLLHLEAMTAMRKGNPKLGLSYVFMWGPVSWGFDPNWIDPMDTSNPPRPKHTTELTIPVTFHFNGQSLLT